jgi:hypothetical protein
LPGHQEAQREAWKPFRLAIDRNMHRIADITGDDSYRCGYKLDE